MHFDQKLYIQEKKKVNALKDGHLNFLYLVIFCLVSLTYFTLDLTLARSVIVFWHKFGAFLRWLSEFALPEIWNHIAWHKSCLIAKTFLRLLLEGNLMCSAPLVELHLVIKTGHVRGSSWG